jgi:hypothetical protein
MRQSFKSVCLIWIFFSHTSLGDGSIDLRVDRSTKLF